MDRLFLNNFTSIMNNENISINELSMRIRAKDFKETTHIINDFINNNIEELLEMKDFWDNYYLFLCSINEKIVREKDKIILKKLIENNVKILKAELKKYTKDGVHKDYHYFMINVFLNKIKDLFLEINTDLEEYREKELFTTIWFIITELKKPDYLFHILANHPEYANIKNKENKHLFILLCEYYLVNLRFMKESDIKYYKRIFVLLLESDNLHLKNKHLYKILERLEREIKYSSIENKCHISFLINEIERHYEIINQDSRLNCQDYINKTHPLITVKRKKEERIDLKDMFTISIDTINDVNSDKRLIDDAFSFKKNKDNTYDLYVHIPDVDHYIKKDSELDFFMRSLGESVYASCYRQPLIPYTFANRYCSLKQGFVRPCITFFLKISEDGEVLDIDFYKSVANVNVNLTRKKADEYLEKEKGYRFLKNMYEMSLVLRRKRGETIGKRNPSSIIMDEANIITDISTASYFKENGIIFPYRNYDGKKSKRNVLDVSICEHFLDENHLESKYINLLYSVFNTKNRVTYDTIPRGNKSFNNIAIGNVGNPLREYISLETDRLIKDLLINKENNYDYWEERIERDCIEYTETSAKMKELYHHK